MQVHRFSNRLKTSLWGNKSKYPRFPIHSTLLLPNTISFPKASCNLRTCEAVFAVKSSSMFTFLFSMFTFSRVNVHFFRFFKSAADVQYPVMKRMILVQQEIAKEYRCRSGVALTENMDLPQSWNKKRKMVDDFIHRKVLIRELLLLRKIIVQCRPQLRGAAVE